MIHIVTLYGQPADPAGFDDYYFNHHLALKPSSNVVGATIGRVNSTDDSDCEYYRMAMVSFLDREQMEEAVNSAEGRAMVEDVKNFAPEGTIRMVLETDNIPVKPAQIAQYLRNVVPYKLTEAANKVKRLIA